MPSSLLEPVWVEFAALLPERGEFHPDQGLLHYAIAGRAERWEQPVVRSLGRVR
jgi:hypothetical protein